MSDKKDQMLAAMAEESKNLDRVFGVQGNLTADNLAQQKLHLMLSAGALAKLKTLSENDAALKAEIDADPVFKNKVSAFSKLVEWDEKQYKKACDAHPALVKNAEASAQKAKSDFDIAAANGNHDGNEAGQKMENGAEGFGAKIRNFFGGLWDSIKNLFSGKKGADSHDADEKNPDGTPKKKSSISSWANSIDIGGIAGAIGGFLGGGALGSMFGGGGIVGTVLSWGLRIAGIFIGQQKLGPIIDGWLGKTKPETTNAPVPQPLVDNHKTIAKTNEPASTQHALTAEETQMILASYNQTYNRLHGITTNDATPNMPAAPAMNAGRNTVYNGRGN